MATLHDYGVLGAFGGFWHLLAAHAEVGAMRLLGPIQIGPQVVDGLADTRGHEGEGVAISKLTRR